MSKRELFLIDGTPVLSVTETIDLLGLNKRDLMGWANWCGQRGVRHDDESKAAAELGTAVHAAIERTLRGEEQPALSTDPFASGVEREAHALWKAWREQWASGRELEPIAIERKLVMTSTRMHGTCDFVARENGRVVLYDWKSSSKDEPKLEHFVQACAYCVMLEDAGDVVDDVCIVTINKKTKHVTEHRRAVAELDRERELWWLAWGLARWMENR